MNAMPEVAVQEAVAVPAAVAGALLLALVAGGLLVWGLWLADRTRRGWSGPRHLAALRALPWDGEDLLRLGVCVSSMILLFLLLRVVLQQAEAGERVVARMAAGQNTLLQVVLALFLAMRIRRQGGGLRGSFQCPGVGTLWEQCRLGLRYYLMLVPVVLLVILFWRGLLHGLGVPGTAQPVFTLVAGDGSSVWLQAWLVLAALVGAPFLEEALFRGLLLPVVLRRLDGRGAVVVASALFALVHGHLTSMVPLFVVGTAFSLAYLYSGSLVVPIVMHAAFNGVNLLVFFLYQAAA